MKNDILNFISKRNLEYFYYPINITKFIEEINKNYNKNYKQDDLFNLFKDNDELIYYNFSNPKGHKTKSRPHCLYLFSRDLIGIDQEDCIRNTLKNYLINKKYAVKEEINYIDLIAENEDVCILFEIKGKQTYDWSTLAFCMGLEQCFPLKMDEAILKLRKSIGFGASEKTKGQMFNYQTQKRKILVLLVPGFIPTMVWTANGNMLLNNQIYHKEIEKFRKLLADEFLESNTVNNYLRYLEEQFLIKEHYGVIKSDWSFVIAKFNGLEKNIDFVIKDAITNENLNIFI